MEQTVVTSENYELLLGRWLPLKTMNYSWVSKKQGGPNKRGGRGGVEGVGGLEH